MRSYMNRKFSFILALLTLSFSFVACDDDDEKEKGVDLTLDKTEIVLAEGESETVTVQDGNGEYSVYSTNGDAAIAIIKGNEITIMATSADSLAYATITVNDKANRKATVDVKVTNLFLNASTNKLYLGVEGEDEAVIKVITGNPAYKAELIENSDQILKLDATNLASKYECTVKAIKTGTGKLKITDGEGREFIVEITVLTPKPVTVNNYNCNFTATQEQQEIAILTGNGEYKLSVSDSSIIKVSLLDTILTVTGKKNGEATILITDSKKQVSEPINIKVNGPKYAMNFGDQYFGYVKFGGMADTDPSIKACQQVTFELTCKLDQFNWLKTFMGLEGKLLLRADGDGKRFEINEQENPQLFSMDEFPLNEWINIALVVDYTQSEMLEQYKLYINGVQQNLRIQNGSNKRSSVNLTSSNDGDRFVIGQASGDDRRLLHGIVSEARVWKVARTQAQIQSNMFLFTEIVPQGLLARWEFTAGCETNYIQDISGGKFENNLNLTNKGGDYSEIKVPMSVWVNDLPNQ